MVRPCHGQLCGPVESGLENRTAGIDDAGFSGHSLRIGAATAAAAAGIPDHTIKMLGRWQSEAYHLYIRTPRETLAGYSRLLGANC